MLSNFEKKFRCNWHLWIIEFKGLEINGKFVIKLCLKLFLKIIKVFKFCTFNLKNASRIYQKQKFPLTCWWDFLFANLQRRGHFTLFNLLISTIRMLRKHSFSPELTKTRCSLNNPFEYHFFNKVNKKSFSKNI